MGKFSFYVILSVFWCKHKNNKNFTLYKVITGQYSAYSSQVQPDVLQHSSVIDLFSRFLLKSQCQKIATYNLYFWCTFDLFHPRIHPPHDVSTPRLDDRVGHRFPDENSFRGLELFVQTINIFLTGPIHMNQELISAT